MALHTNQSPLALHRVCVLSFGTWQCVFSQTNGCVSMTLFTSRASGPNSPATTSFFKVFPPAPLRAFPSGCLTAFLYTQLIKRWLHTLPYQARAGDVIWSCNWNANIPRGTHRVCLRQALCGSNFLLSAQDRVQLTGWEGSLKLSCQLCWLNCLFC